jgi:Virulence factor BrkB
MGGLCATTRSANTSHLVGTKLLSGLRWLSTDQQIASLWDLGGLSWRELARRVWGGINQNDLLNRAYELAYNFLLALFPLLLCLVAMLGLFASESSKLQSDLFFYFQQVVPPAAYHLVIRTLNEITANSGGGKITLGLLLALLSGSGGMTQLMSTLNAAYEVREARSWLRVRLISLGLTIPMSLLIIAALLLILAGVVGRPYGAGFGIEPFLLGRRACAAVGHGLGFCSARVCGDLLLCTSRKRTALVLDHPWFRRGSAGMGVRLSTLARLSPFLQHISKT